MKLASTRNGMRLRAEAAQPNSTAAVQAEVERILTVIRSVHSELVNQTPDGLELRVLAALQASPVRRRGAAGWEIIMQHLCSRAWAPVAVSATLLCVFTGGIFVARETSLAFQTQQALLAGSQMRLGRAPVSASPQVEVAGAEIDAAKETKNLATASARQKPASPISVGQRRGRASAARALSSR